MKKLFSKAILAIATLISFSSCNESYQSRIAGGTMKVNIPKGYRLIEATWKDGANLWYLVEPMDSDYTPKEKMLIEKSAIGIVQGQVIFVESK